jgi:hypothetical protein
MYSALRVEYFSAEVADARGGQDLGGGERVERLGARGDRRAVAPHESGATGEGERQVDLLGRDRAHEHLEWRRRERRAQTIQLLAEAGQHRIGLGQPIEPRQVEVEAEDPPDLGGEGGLAVHAARAGRADLQAWLVHRAGPAHLVGNEIIAVPEHPTKDIARDAIGRILAPPLKTHQRGTNVERAVGSEHDLHRRVTRPLSVPDSSRPSRRHSGGHAAHSDEDGAARPRR